MLLAHPVVHSFTSQAAKIVALARNGQVSEGFRMKIGGWLVAFAALALVGCGSGSGDNGSASTTGTTGTTTTSAGTVGSGTAAGKNFKVTMIAKSTSNPVFQYAKT